jgi:DNA-binding NarL/FixJ family response regulator
VVTEALSFGGRGHVLKIRDVTDLLAAVEAVLGGGRVVSRGLIASELD